MTPTLESLGPWRHYGDDVYHCWRCHKLVRCYDVPDDWHELVLSAHDQIWHTPLDLLGERQQATVKE